MNQELALPLGISLGVFLLVIIAISILAGRKIKTQEDFIVAGRGLSTLMTMATVMATWYAAETILVTADWVASDGISVIVMEPLGLGLCIVLAGSVYATRVWKTGHMTLPDIWREHYGVYTEKLAALMNLSYMGWVAVQLIGLGGVMHVYFGISLSTAIVIIAVILTAYTLIGGMWSVAMTDIVQLAVLLVGVVLLTLKVLGEFGGNAFDGLGEMLRQVDARLLDFVPAHSGEALLGWFSLIVLGLLSQIASQDVIQRIFSARSPDTAKRACNTAGVLYIVFGALPVMLGLAGTVLFPGEDQQLVARLAETFLSPTMSIVFAVALTAAITSSVDSGLLAPASVLSRNLFAGLVSERLTPLRLTRICVVGVAIGATALALSGERPAEMLMATYAMSIPPLVLLTAVVFQKRTRRLPGQVTYTVGAIIWVVNMVKVIATDDPDAELVPGFYLYLFLICVVVYVVTDWWAARREPPGSRDQEASAGSPA